ncbi:hypothetical protein RND81_02G082300 [Saponaria officinalis]
MITWMGRRKTLLGSLLTILVGMGSIVLFPTATSSVILGFMAMNFGLGGITRVIPIIKSELAPEKWPKLYDIGSSFGGPLCVLAIYLVTNHQKWGWKMICGGLSVFILIIFVLAFFLTESPLYMLEKRNKYEAVNILLTLDRKERVGEMLGKLEIIRQQLANRPSSVLLSPVSRPPLIVSVVSSTLALFSAVNLLQSYGPFLFQSANLSAESLYLPSLIISAIQIFFHLITWFGLRRYKRRNILVAAILTKVVSEAMLGGVFSTISFLFVYFAQVRRVFVPGAFIVAADAVLTTSGVWLDTTFPDESKDVGETFTICLGLLQNLIIGSISMLVFCKLNKYIFYMYIFWDGLLYLFISKYVPETTGIEATKAWSSHSYWNKYVKPSDVFKFF